MGKVIFDVKFGPPGPEPRDEPFLYVASDKAGGKGLACGLRFGFETGSAGKLIKQSAECFLRRALPLLCAGEDEAQNLFAEQCGVEFECGVHGVLLLMD